MSEFNPYTPPEAFRKNAEKNDALNDSTSAKGHSDNIAANQQSQSDAQNTASNVSDTVNNADSEALRNVRLELVRLQLQEQGHLNQSLRPE